MRVKVKLFATFRKGRFKEQEMHFSDGYTVLQVVQELKIPPKELGIVFRNGHAVEPEAVLAEGDILSIFPMVGGG